MENLLNKNSLFTQLIVRIFAIGTATMVVTFAFIHFQMDRSLEVLRDETVQEQASDLGNYLRQGGDEGVRFSPPDHVRRFYAKSGSSYQYLVRDGKGKILFRSPFAYNSYFPADAAHTGEFEFKGPAEFDYVGYTLEVPL